MGSTRRNTLIAVLILCPVATFAQESKGYTVTVANEQLRFVPQPEAGYVVELQDKPGGIGAERKVQNEML